MVVSGVYLWAIFRDNASFVEKKYHTIYRGVLRVDWLIFPGSAACRRPCIYMYDPGLDRRAAGQRQQRVVGGEEMSHNILWWVEG